MKKHIISIMIISIFSLLLLAGCNASKMGTSKNIGSDKRVLDAIEIVAEHWNNEYEEREIEDKYLEIINTRIIKIKENIDSKQIFEKDDLFKGIDYIVEFELISNYYETAPYYFSVWQDNFVIVYKDGTTKVSNNLLNMYRGTTYSNDFSPIIESVEDFHSDYDQVLELE